MTEPQFPRLDPQSPEYAMLLDALERVEQQPPSAAKGNHALLMMAVHEITERWYNKEDSIQVAYYLLGLN